MAATAAFSASLGRPIYGVAHGSWSGGAWYVHTPGGGAHVELVEIGVDQNCAGNRFAVLWRPLAFGEVTGNFDISRCSGVVREGLAL